MQYLTIALTKGRLAGQTMELFEKAGYFCEELKDKKSRKLIFTNEEQKLRFFLSKGPDVPTYVEYGAADIGIRTSFWRSSAAATRCWIWASAAAACVWRDLRRQKTSCSTTR